MSLEIIGFLLLVIIAIIFKSKSYEKHISFEKDGAEKNPARLLYTIDLSSADTVPDDAHFVEVHSQASCCHASKKLKGIRYLSTETPRMPLAACSRKICNCSYFHHDERRRASRRQNTDIPDDSCGLYGETDNRVIKGRRHADSGAS